MLFHWWSLNDSIVTRMNLVNLFNFFNMNFFSVIICVLLPFTNFYLRSWSWYSCLIKHLLPCTIVLSFIFTICFFMFPIVPLAQFIIYLTSSVVNFILFQKPTLINLIICPPVIFNTIFVNSLWQFNLQITLGFNACFSNIISLTRINSFWFLNKHTWCITHLLYNFFARKNLISLYKSSNIITNNLIAYYSAIALFRLTEIHRVNRTAWISLFLTWIYLILQYPHISFSGRIYLCLWSFLSLKVSSKNHTLYCFTNFHYFLTTTWINTSMSESSKWRFRW